MLENFLTTSTAAHWHFPKSVFNGMPVLVNQHTVSTDSN